MATQKEKKLEKQSKGKRKSSIHKDFSELEVTMTNGEKCKMFSAVKDKAITLDIDPLSHGAWKDGDKSKADNTRFTKVKDFNDKYEGLDI